MKIGAQEYDRQAYTTVRKRIKKVKKKTSNGIHQITPRKEGTTEFTHGQPTATYRQ
jgi:hypothetical protein